jgi:hypothetical protein
MDRETFDKRYEELRNQAMSQGFEMPPAPPWTEGPQWLSFDEMQALMEAQGVDMKQPSPVSARTPPPQPGNAEEQMRIFDTIGKMTPEQQRACFALSSWHGPRMQRQMPPAYVQPFMPQHQRGHAPRFGQPHRGMLRSQ